MAARPTWGLKFARVSRKILRVSNRAQGLAAGDGEVFAAGLVFLFGRILGVISGGAKRFILTCGSLQLAAGFQFCFPFLARDRLFVVELETDLAELPPGFGAGGTGTLLLASCDRRSFLNNLACRSNCARSSRARLPRVRWTSASLCDLEPESGGLSSAPPSSLCASGPRRVARADENVRAVEFRPGALIKSVTKDAARPCLLRVMLHPSPAR